MKPSWNERNTFEKAVFVVQCLCAVALVICLGNGFLFNKELTDWMYPIIGIEGFLEAAVQWKYNRKSAILSVLVGISSMVVFLLVML